MHFVVVVLGAGAIVDSTGSFVCFRVGRGCLDRRLDMKLEKTNIDLMEIGPNWFYQKFKYKDISKLCNVLVWEGSVAKSGEILSEHAVSVCVAMPCTDSMTGPMFANVFLANVADFFVRSKLFDNLYVNGDALLCRTEETNDDGNPVDKPLSFSFYKFANGISFVYFGFTNYSSRNEAIGMSAKQISAFVEFCETLSVGIAQTAFVNGLFASMDNGN
jgi:hypothetical protein